MESVALKYVYTDKYAKVLKREVTHFEFVPYLDEPRSVEDYLYNECVRLNNYRSVPNAHLRSMNEIIRILWTHRPKYRRMRCPYDERIQEEQDPLKRQALQYFRDGIRILELREQIDNLKVLYNYSMQESYTKALHEMDRIERSIPYSISS